MKNVHNPYYPYCNNEFQTVCHLVFVTCAIAVRFWNNFIEFELNDISPYPRITSAFPEREILYGVVRSFSSCLTLKHLILIGKYFLYCKAVNNDKPLFEGFFTVTLVAEKI